MNDGGFCRFFIFGNVMGVANDGDDVWIPGGFTSKRSGTSQTRQREEGRKEREDRQNKKTKNKNNQYQTGPEIHAFCFTIHYLLVHTLYL